ncbi:MAG: hypothetical protein LBS35_11190 [Synergistaceae bacterium]|nr:hypothetical protein [Synergistaceae bacterium]
MNETPQPREIKEYPCEDGYIRVLRFEDDSDVIYYPGGEIKYAYTPWNMGKGPPPVPLALLYLGGNHPNADIFRRIAAYDKQ